MLNFTVSRNHKMFWGPKKKKDEVDKEKQIKELKQVFPSIRRPNNDENLFEIKFVVNNQYSSLRVFIPADFPSTRPGNIFRALASRLSIVLNEKILLVQFYKLPDRSRTLGWTSSSRSMAAKRYASYCPALVVQYLNILSSHS